MGFPCSSVGKESACNVEDLGSIPGLGRSGEGKCYPFPVFRPGECRRLYSPWCRKESDMTEPVSLDARGISPGGYKRSRSPKIWHHPQDRQSKDSRVLPRSGSLSGLQPTCLPGYICRLQPENCQAKFSVHK